MSRPYSGIFLHTKDVQRLTQQSNRSACRLVALIRAANGKTSGQLITVREFCDFMGVEEEIVRELLSQ